MAKAIIRWVDRNTDEVEQRIYRSESPIDPTNLPVPFDVVGPSIEEYEDETVEDDKIYYYRVSSVRGDGLERVSDEISVDTEYNLGPGSNELIGGSASAGFFGEVPVSELWSGNELASEIGYSDGSSHNSDEPWLKFIFNREIVYVAKKTYRFGGAAPRNPSIIQKDGYNFSVNIMTDDEWESLLYRVHEDDPSGDPWVNYTNADLNIGGNGRRSWAQGSGRYWRGGDSITGSGTYGSSLSLNNTLGWRPILRIFI